MASFPEVIDRLFRRLAGAYGSAWDRSLGAVPIDDVKKAWAAELQGFDTDDIAWAIDNLPDTPPNSVQFRKICRLAPRKPEPLRLEVKADPERVAQELQKLAPVRQPNPYDGKEWARRILKRHEAGDPIPMLNVRFAKEALRLNQRKEDDGTEES